MRYFLPLLVSFNVLADWDLHGPIHEPGRDFPLWFEAILLIVIIAALIIWRK